MKKLFLLSVMCILALTIRAQRCAVLDFQVGNNITEEEVDGVTYAFRSNFRPTNYTILERMMINKVVADGYTDLGLPSGTIWKNFNATGFYTYDEAVSQFGSRLPSKAQLEELKTECQWTWTGSGYKVTGPNGNSIILPAEGYRDCFGSVRSVGSYGHYWSSTPDGSDDAWYLIFDMTAVVVDGNYRCFRLSVRLVQD